MSLVVRCPLQWVIIDNEVVIIFVGIFLHILADTLGSVGVIISSILIQQFGKKLISLMYSISLLIYKVFNLITCGRAVSQL